MHFSVTKVPTRCSQCRIKSNNVSNGEDREGRSTIRTRRVRKRCKKKRPENHNKRNKHQRRKRKEKIIMGGRKSKIRVCLFVCLFVWILIKGDSEECDGINVII